MRDAVIVDAVRTPLGKRGGGLSATHPARLSSSVLKAQESRVGLDPAVVDDVIWGSVTQVAEQAANVALRRPVILLAIGVVLLYKRLHELQGAVA
jgi:acetyl-CoA acyltransferase